MKEKTTEKIRRQRQKNKRVSRPFTNGGHANFMKKLKLGMGFHPRRGEIMLEWGQKVGWGKRKWVSIATLFHFFCYVYGQLASYFACVYSTDAQQKSKAWKINENEMKWATVGIKQRRWNENRENIEFNGRS